MKWRQLRGAESHSRPEHRLSYWGGGFLHSLQANTETLPHILHTSLVTAIQQCEPALLTASLNKQQQTHKPRERKPSNCCVDILEQYTRFHPITAHEATNSYVGRPRYSDQTGTAESCGKFSWPKYKWGVNKFHWVPSSAPKNESTKLSMRFFHSVCRGETVLVPY
jgi:hypothetical protein